MVVQGIAMSGVRAAVKANNLLGSDYIDGVYAFDPEGELEGGDNVDLVFTDLSIAGVLAFDPEGDLEAGDDVDLAWTQTQLTYQHYQDGVAIDGATDAVLSLTDIDETANGSYTLRATNPITGKFKLFGPLVIDGVSGVSGVTPTKGLFVGDSTVAIYSSFPSIFDALLSSQEITDGFTVSGIAVPGHTIAQQKTAWVAYADKLLLDYVWVQVGLNDMNPAVATATTIAAYQDLIDTIRAGVSADCKIIGATMTPAYNRWPAVGWTQADAQAKWVALNDSIMGRGGSPITGLDTSAESHTIALTMDVSGNAALATAYDSGDGIHQNTFGRQVCGHNNRVVIQSIGMLYPNNSVSPPLSIPGSIQWVDAQNVASVLTSVGPDVVAVTDDDVAKWADLTLAGMDFTQSTVKPALKALGASAYRGIDFNGTNEFLQSTLPAAIATGFMSVVLFTTDTGHALFHDGTLNTKFLYVAQSGSAGTPIVSGNANLRMWLDGVEQTFANRGALYTAMNNRICVLSVMSTNLLTNWTTTANAFRIGLFNGTPFQFTGQVGEILLSRTILPDEHISIWHNYVKTKYGIA